MKELIEPKDKKTGLRFRTALVCDIELTNGHMTQMTTIFNGGEINFEEINWGINQALSRCCNIKRSQHTLCKLNNGELEPLAWFPITEYKL
jgi:hypothetical protein